MSPPESTARQRNWEAKYQAGTTGWDRGGISPALAAWLDRGELQSGRVLVPGCGNGHEVVELARAGCQVTAVDIAAPPVARLTDALVEQGQQARVVQADLLHWTPAQPFDAIYEQTCLCALDPAQWPAYAGRLAGWLRPGGRLFALFMQTGQEGGPPHHCDLAQMRELFPDDLWQWPQDEPQQVAHPNGLYELACVLVRRGGAEQPADA